MKEPKFAKSLAKNHENFEALYLVITSVGHILTKDEVQELLGDQNMEAVIDYFSGGKYSKALNEAAKVREEMAIERAEMAALKDKIMKIRAEKTAFAAEIAALKDKAAFAEEKDAFAKEKDKILISNLYNDKVELDTINHSFWLNIDEIKKSFQISDLFLPFTN